MLVIPAIDLLNGKVVRLKKGDYNEVTVYNDDPVAEAIKFKNAGFRYIHVVDLNGAKEGLFVNLDVIRQIMDDTGLSIQTGGGIRTYQDGEELLENGIQRIICSSMAVKNTGDWYRLIETYQGRAVLGMDLKDGKMAYGGWLETSDQSIADFLKPMVERGLKTVLSTDISRDGMLSGPNMDLYKELQKEFPDLNFIASGGVSSAEDLRQLESLDLYGVVVGRAYYEDRISLQQMTRYHTV